ncbi:flagellar filament capping protein FliD [Desulfofundulus thermocisternus]|uniref:flagellar filament capping protein FliD n=1 Tax=Desulfofundulus thermocisternus TaxID=42471 RepID=UPI00217CF0D5|nr:flagellar filament capping protein FliD [Desulfofundulus thermocisternus]MCS5696636.1 flagellar filament capping protein FliD [Desulfofundulus thermocisternus]
MSFYFNPVNRMTGLASGLDTKSIVEDLMKAARMPLDRMLQNQQLLKWQQEDYRAINITLNDLKANYAFPLELQSTFLVKRAVSSDESAVTATAGANASTGTYQVTVVALAQVGSLVSSDKLTSSTNTGFDPDAKMSDSDKSFGLTDPTSFTITTYKSDGSPDQNIVINVSPDQTLNQLLADIYTKTSGRLTAFYEASTQKVVISTTKTGYYNENKFTFSDGADNFLSDKLKITPQDLYGQDAELSINGLTDIRQHENTFILNNVTFNLKKTTSPSSVLISVQTDTDTIVQKIKDFVEQYNAALDQINKKLSEPRYRDYLPLTEDQKKELSEDEIKKWEEKARSGLLQNDPLLQDIVYDLRTAITGTVKDLNKNMDSLFDIGITEGYMLDDSGKIILGGYTEGGKLYINEKLLRDAVSRDPEGVMKLFTQTGATDDQKGIGVRFYEALNRAIDRLTREAGAPSSFSLVDNSFLSTSIREMQDRIDRENERLALLESRYWEQFTLMEQYIAQMNSQSIWLAQQFNMYGGR